MSQRHCAFRLMRAARDATSLHAAMGERLPALTGARGTRAVDNVANLRQVFDVFFAVARNATLLQAISPNATQGQIYLDTVRARRLRVPSPHPRAMHPDATQDHVTANMVHAC